MISDIQIRTIVLDSVPCIASTHMGAGEERELAGLRSSKRRREYLAGRFLGKQLLSEISGVLPGEIEILSRDVNRRPTRPRVFRSGNPTGWQISISHHLKRVMVAATIRNDCRIGCDLETVATLGPGFRELWFTESERNWLETPRAPEASVVWAAKEAAYKAMNRGEKFMPRKFEVGPESLNRWQCKYRSGAGQRICPLEVIEMNQEVAIIAAYLLKDKQHD